MILVTAILQDWSTTNRHLNGQFNSVRLAGHGKCKLSIAPLQLDIDYRAVCLVARYPAAVKTH